VSVAQAEVERILARPPEPVPAAVERNLMDVVAEIARREGKPQLVNQLQPAQ